MSAALVRQALEFVDPAENISKPKKRGNRLRGAAGQESQIESEPEKQLITAQSDKKQQDTISKLLKLSQPTLEDKDTVKKIVKRAATGKPVFDKIKVKKEETKSILFPEENEKSSKKKSKKRQNKKDY